MGRNTMGVLVGLLLATAGAPAAGWAAQDYAAQWGPPLGTPQPLLDAPDHTGRDRSFGDLVGERGLLLQFSRSVDW